MSNIRFNDTECWIILCIPLNDQGVDLSELIARADMTNKLIPNDYEIETALTKGIKTGIVKMIDDKFIMTSEFQMLIESIYKKHPSFFDTRDKLKKELNKLDLVDNEPDFTFKLKQGESKKAFEKYSEWIKEQLKKR